MKNPLQYIARAAASLFHKVKSIFIQTNKNEIITVSDPFPKVPVPSRADRMRMWKKTHGKAGDKIARMAAAHRIGVRNP